MNCEELVRKMNNKDNDLEILNELTFENETNVLEMLQTTDNYLKRLDSLNTSDVPDLQQ
jgi:hypothetical protein